MHISQTIIAEGALYSWACGDVSNDDLKAEFHQMGLEIDLRQAGNSHIMEAVDIQTGDFIWLEI